MGNKKKISPEQTEQLIQTLKTRFEKNRLHGKTGPLNLECTEWSEIQSKLESNPNKLWSLNEMEETGGEPELVEYDKKKSEFIFFDCSAESPKDRRSVCYDREALESRKVNKPKNSALGMAAEMGIDLLTEEQYRTLQKFKKCDTKTSSWIQTPADIRKFGGAIFGDWRYGHVFVYHNGPESYYATRGFRGVLTV